MRTSASTSSALLVALALSAATAASWATPVVAPAWAEDANFVAIPAGTYEMGSSADEDGRYDDEGPVHAVHVRAFALARYPVTRGEFAAFVRDTGYDAGHRCEVWDGRQFVATEARDWRNPGFAQTDRDPVVCVNWQDAQAYAAWLGRSSGRHYRLPTEAEWEYAARAGTASARFWGERADDACAYANVADLSAKKSIGSVGLEFHDCDDGAVYTAHVGRYRSNRFDLYDMLGNVWQWTQDCYHETYAGAPADGSAWAAGNCRYRVLRGGSWLSPPRSVRSAKRYWIEPSERYCIYGFRLVREE